MTVRRASSTTMSKANLSASKNFGAALASGQRVCGGRYLLKRRIGGGEISEVWLVRNVTDGKDVALKLLPSRLLSDKNLLEQVADEVRRTRLLQHPHLVANLELVSDHRSVAIVTEYVDGWSLATLKVDKLCCCYTVEEIGPWIRQVGAALAHAHNAFGLVHGDLKPSNLLLSEREGIKISDFGFAALLRTERARRGLAQGIYSGIGFLGPQQVMGGAPSKLDDIYSLGATIFDLLTGTPPFHKGEIIAQICSLPPPTMTQRMKELEIQADPISPVWETTVAACLAKNPADRPQDVSEVMRLLERTEVLESTAPASQTEPDELEAKETQEPVAEPEPVEVTVAAPLDLPPTILTSPSRTPAKLAGVLVALAVVGLAAMFWFVHDSNPAAKASSSNALVVVHSPGSVDKSFNVDGGANDSIRCLAVQPDGKILIGGMFSKAGEVDTRRIARLDPDGRVEPVFPWQPPGTVNALAVQSDGKIIAAGTSMVGQKLPRVHVVRVRGDGQREPDWGLRERFNAEVRTMAIQPDGKILVGGSFTLVSKKHLRRLLRLKPDGSLDDTFNIGKGASATVWSIAVQADGKILVGGAFSEFNGRQENHLVRLNPDGSFDPGFKHMTGTDGGVMAIVPQANGKILIGGKFDSMNGMASCNVARLSADGSIDASFNPGTGPDGLVQSIAVQQDGKIIIGGGFNSVCGKPRHGVARLNADGTLDESFKVGEGASGFVWKVAVQSDGKILVTGDFETFDGVPSGRIARLED